MSLWLRIQGTDLVNPRIPGHAVTSIAAEWARGGLTGAQAQAAVAAVSSGVGLTPAEVTKAQALVATVTGLPDPVDRLQQTAKIMDVLLLLAENIPPYHDPATVEALIDARLGT